ncbi:uncharacterized protein [Henckelia pumila]|uniref:uncharacterized protein n=1 Tax=Henckelia pumila TaxID=405737 RepID=UPI003C6DC0F1
MRICNKSIDERAWQCILNVWSPPRRTDEDGDIVIKSETEWTEDEIKCSNYNSKDLNDIFYSVDVNMFGLITNCVCSKLAWENLQTHCEGSDSVRRTKLRMLSSKFENLRMEENETLDDSDLKLRDIANESLSLGETISNERLVNKTLRSLPERFNMNNCAIEESKDTSALSLSVAAGVATLGCNISLRPVCLNTSNNYNLSNPDADDEGMTLEDVKKLYKELYVDWINRKNLNTTLSEENTDLKAAVSRLEVILSFWYFDSGSSRHITSSRQFLIDYVLLKIGKVTYGGGSKENIVGKGTLDVA